MKRTQNILSLVVYRHDSLRTVCGRANQFSKQVEKWWETCRFLVIAMQTKSVKIEKVRI